MTPTTSSLASETLRARKRVSGTSWQDDVGPQGVDGGDGALDVVGLGDDVQVGSVGGQLGAHPGADQGVVVDDQDPQGRARIGGLVVVCGGTGGRVSHEGLPGGDVG